MQCYTKQMKWLPHRKQASFQKGSKRFWEDHRFPLHSTPHLDNIHVTVPHTFYFQSTSSMNSSTNNQKNTLLKRDKEFVQVSHPTPCSGSLVSAQASEDLNAVVACEINHPSHTYIVGEVKQDKYIRNYY